MSLLIFSSSMTRCMVKRTTTRSIQSLRTAFLSQSFFFITLVAFAAFQRKLCQFTQLVL